MSAVVRVENVSKTYKGRGVPVEALHDTSFSVGSGEFTAICGPSGSGKTTLLNIIGTIDSPTSGSVFIEDKDTATLSKKQLASIRLSKLGFIFQSYNLIPVLTCQENAEFVLLLQGVTQGQREEIVNEVLKDVGLEDKKHAFPRELSGGQQQRVAVARAIASRPKLILADEPTANLDSKTGKDLIDLMLELNQKYEVTFLFSTHDPMVMEAAKKIISIKDGRIVDTK
ncbi:ABC transporter ATP-binding protein [Candidatus Uabimicrobium sp. HlEnr_7]|uniref:ABC transporter ATP-binding protein n=1 Tax=Candidatus Uabimicrobium helgolandensis TaxID=3095367 RepID=UPI0035567480